MEENRINTDFADAFKLRTKKQSVAIIKFLKTIKSNEEMLVIKHQLIKSATSTAANYRAACRGKSKADFIAKLGIVNEEADETVFWLEVIEDLDYKSEQLNLLKKESEEILKIVAKSIATSRSNYNKN
jgi:four helix bundle protein